MVVFPLVAFHYFKACYTILGHSDLSNVINIAVAVRFWALLASCSLLSFKRGQSGQRVTNMSNHALLFSAHFCLLSCIFDGHLSDLDCRSFQQQGWRIEEADEIVWRREQKRASGQATIQVWFFFLPFWFVSSWLIDCNWASSSFFFCFVQEKYPQDVMCPSKACCSSQSPHIILVASDFSTHSPGIAITPFCLSSFSGFGSIYKLMGWEDAGVPVPNRRMHTISFTCMVQLAESVQTLTAASGLLNDCSNVFYFSLYPPLFYANGPSRDNWHWYITRVCLSTYFSIFSVDRKTCNAGRGVSEGGNQVNDPSWMVMSGPGLYSCFMFMWVGGMRWW